MRILSLGSDPHLFVSGSRSQEKIKKMSEAFERFDIVTAVTSANLTALNLSDRSLITPARGSNKISELYALYRNSCSILDQSNYDHLTVQDPFLIGIVGVILSQKYDIPLHVQIHTDLNSKYYRRSHWFNWIYVLIASYTLPRAKSIRSVSERAASLPWWFPKTVKPSILPMWIDIISISQNTETLKLKEKYNAKKLILIASRLENEKNLFNILQSYFDTHSHTSTTKLLIVGSGSLSQSLANFVNNKNRAHQVIFENWASNIIPYYYACDLFITFSNYEGFGLTMAEAAATRTPVICSNVGLVGELLTEKEVSICPIKDFDCLKANLLSWKTDERPYKNKALLAQQKILSEWPTYDSFLNKFKATFS